MYHVFYLYRVRTENVERFLQIVSAAGDIFRRFGASASVAMRVTEAADKYGCRGLAGVASSGEEQLFLGIDSFRDESQYKMLMPMIDADPQINELFEEIQQVVDLKTVVRWEAEEIG